MKCRDCPDYKMCSRAYDLRIIRQRCEKAKWRKSITNADRIRAMTDEELATWIDDYAAYAWCPVDAPIDPETHECLVHDGDCRLCILDWLRKEEAE